MVSSLPSKQIMWVRFPSSALKKFMINLHVNDIKVTVPNNTTILQACDEIGIDIPRFCFHERLLVAGNCRMCLVEIEKSPKPVPSCTIPVMEGMKVYTNTPLVKKAQEAVLEFLLINHPLDCPICDQGGECDLQDQSVNFGSDSSRFYIKKRGVEDKNLGPIIKTVMTRCIHCTRCVRFATEVAGLKDLGTTGRGKKTEIGTYVSKIVKTELSGNIVDLCPVGALTSKVYAFKARPWELKSVSSIDVLDSLGSNIIVQKKGNDIIRILPSLNESLNEEWLTDKARYSFDGIKTNRLDSPLIKLSNNKFNGISWENSFKTIFNKLSTIVNSKGISNTNIKFLMNSISDLDTAYSCELFLKSFKGNVSLNSYKNHKNMSFNKDLDIHYRSSNIIDSMNNSDLILLVGLNLKEEIPLLWVKLRNYINKSGVPTGVIGNNVDYGFDYKHIGLDNKSLIQCIEGNNIFLKDIINAKNPLILVGENSISSNFDVISSHLSNINKNINFSVINSNIADSGLSELGFSPVLESDKKEDICFNFGNIDYITNPKSFNIFIGSHGSNALINYDLILPSLTYLEQESFFMNFNGIVQKSGKLSKLVLGARKGSEILEALQLFLQKSDTGLFFNNDQRLSLFSKFLKKEKKGLTGLNLNSYFSKKFQSGNSVSQLNKYYLNNEISKSSRTMQTCQSLNVKSNNF